MLRFSANLSTMFQELPLVQRLEAAACAGFDAVELWFPYEIPVPKMRQLLRDNGLRCVGINSPAGDPARGDWGLAADPERRAEFDKSVEMAFKYAREIECPCVHVMAGQCAPGTSVEAAWGNYLECLGSACDAARGYGITAMVEPLNAIDRPTYLMSTQAKAIEVHSKLNRPNLKIMLDVFHVQRGEGNLIERMLTSLPHTAHVQIADNPGRHEPGTGEINFAAIFAAIEKSGYAGYIGLEYLPSGATGDSLQWLEHLRAKK